MLENPESKNKFIQENSPDGGFLQSERWREFQESTGRRTFHVENDGFWANIIEHRLPIVGKYFYIPRGPIIEISNFQFPISKQIQNSKFKIQNSFSELIDLARRNNAGWIRIDPNNSHILDLIRKNWRVVKAPHDMQPREILVIDITKPEEQLLSDMKPKARYNIRVAQKHNVRALCIKYHVSCIKYFNEFIRLVKITAKRDKITPHPESYYRKMLESIPSDILKLYVAEYDEKIIAANIVIFYRNTATYLHGASDYEYRNLMAPYLLQWQAILDAKKAGLKRYDLGGISTKYEFYETTKKWKGITRFKAGFAPNIKPVIFPGSYDIIINPKKYYLYRVLQKIKNIL